MVHTLSFARCRMCTPVRQSLRLPPITQLLERDGTVAGPSPTAGVTEPKEPADTAYLLQQLARERDRAEAQAKEGQRRASELDAVFANIAEAVVVYGSGGMAVKANQTAIEMFGFDPVGTDRATRTERIAIDYADGRAVPSHDLPTCRAERGETFTDQAYRVTGSDGRQHLIHCSGTPLWIDGQLRGTVLSWHDVTERERLVEQLRTERMLLEQRVQERTSSWPDRPLSFGHWRQS